MDSSEIYSKIIVQNLDNHTQIRLTINEFRGTEYLHLRKYYQDFDEEWKPTTDGISFPIDFENCRDLFEGVSEILSLAESKEVIEEYFGDIINQIYQK